MKAYGVNQKGSLCILKSANGKEAIRKQMMPEAEREENQMVPSMIYHFNECYLQRSLTGNNTAATSRPIHVRYGRG